MCVRRPVWLRWREPVRKQSDHQLSGVQVIPKNIVDRSKSDSPAKAVDLGQKQAIDEEIIDEPEQIPLEELRHARPHRHPALHSRIDKTPDQCRLQMNRRQWHTELFLCRTRAQTSARRRHDNAWSRAAGDDFVKQRKIRQKHALSDALKALDGMPEARIVNRRFDVLDGSQLNKFQSGVSYGISEEFVGDDSGAMAPPAKCFRQRYHRIHIARTTQSRQQNVEGRQEGSITHRSPLALNHGDRR